jgi:hypothetical protein
LQAATKDCVLDFVPTNSFNFFRSRTNDQAQKESIPNQHIPVRDASLIRHRTSQPTLLQEKRKGILNFIFQPSHESQSNIEV